MKRRMLAFGFVVVWLVASCRLAQRSSLPRNGARTCGGVRPAGNTGKGLFTSGKTIYDANGCPFIPMGFNALVFWQTDARLQLRSIEAMAAQGANIVRIITQTAGQFGWNADPATQRDLVGRLERRALVSVLEMHDATCDQSINGILDYWKSNSMLQLAKDYERSMWINVANEHNFGTPEAWRDTYLEEIRELRGLGVKNTIVLDMGMAGGARPATQPGVLDSHVRQVAQSAVYRLRPERRWPPLRS
jgi:hypothetical protein